MRVLRITGLLLIAVALLGQVGLAGAVMLADHTEHRLLIVTGGSMEPTYQRGSALIIDELRPDEVRVGAPVTYTSVEGTLTTHRVVSLHTVDGQRYARTKGDANAEPDPNFTPLGSVIGTPVLHVPSGGYVASQLLSPLGRLLTYGPALLVLLLVELRLLHAHVRASRVDREASPSHGASSSGDTRDVRRRRGQVGSTPSAVPVVAAVLVGSLALGAVVERSTALFASVDTSDANVLRTTTLAPPTGLKAAAGLTSIRLTWTRSTSAIAAGYYIYRSGTSGGPYTKVGSVTGGGTQEYTDSSLPLGTFHYVVRAVAHNWSSAPSTQASASILGLL